MIAVQSVKVRAARSLADDDAFGDQMIECPLNTSVRAAAFTLDRAARNRPIGTRKDGEDITIERRGDYLEGALEIHAATIHTLADN